MPIKIFPRVNSPSIFDVQVSIPTLKLNNLIMDGRPLRNSLSWVFRVRRWLSASGQWWLICATSFFLFSTKSNEDFLVTTAECAGTEQIKNGRLGSLRNYSFWVRFFPAVRFEPGTAGYEARTLPLCYAVPPKIKRRWTK